MTEFQISLCFEFKPTDYFFEIRFFFFSCLAHSHWEWKKTVGYPTVFVQLLATVLVQSGRGFLIAKVLQTLP